MAGINVIQLSASFNPSTEFVESNPYTRVFSILEIWLPEIETHIVIELSSFVVAVTKDWDVNVTLNVSNTVTVAFELALLPFTSTAVNVTELLPVSAQAKFVMSKLKLSIEQLSVLPLSISDFVMVAAPFVSR